MLPRAIRADSIRTLLVTQAHAQTDRDTGRQTTGIEMTEKSTKFFHRDQLTRIMLWLHVK